MTDEKVHQSKKRARSAERKEEPPAKRAKTTPVSTARGFQPHDLTTDGFAILLNDRTWLNADFTNSAAGGQHSMLLGNGEIEIERGEDKKVKSATLHTGPAIARKAKKKHHLEILGHKAGVEPSLDSGETIEELDFVVPRRVKGEWMLKAEATGNAGGRYTLSFLDVGKAHVFLCGVTFTV